MWCTLLIPEPSRQKQADLHELEASLTYTVPDQPELHSETSPFPHKMGLGVGRSISIHLYDLTKDAIWAFLLHGVFQPRWTPFLL